jgi:hypothetical protein
MFIKFFMEMIDLSNPENYLKLKKEFKQNMIKLKNKILNTIKKVIK